jgi:hypothetical protein
VGSSGKLGRLVLVWSSPVGSSGNAALGGTLGAWRRPALGPGFRRTAHWSGQSPRTRD